MQVEKASAERNLAERVLITITITLIIRRMTMITITITRDKVVSLNYCSQNGGEIYIGPRIIMGTQIKDPIL